MNIIKNKFFRILISSFLLFLPVFGQIVTTIPTFPTENDEITIIFDASTTPLNNYSGDLYTHTGVITNKSSNSDDWKYVIGNWGNNSIQPKLERLEANKYKMVINNVRQFYKVIDNSEKILKLAFVFRASSGKPQSGNEFVVLYDKSGNVKITKPSDKPFITKINEEFNVEFVKSNLDSVAVFQNNIRKFKFTEDNYSYIEKFTTAGVYRIDVKGYSGGNIVSRDSISIYTRNENNIAALPANIKYGINYIDNNSVTLALHAPDKKFVYILADFNNWEINNDYQMNVTPDNSTYWITISNLTPKQEYAFQYFVDGKIKIADPYTDKILDPWNDKYITESVYPGLKKYPEEKTEEIVSVLQTAQENYQWNVTDFKKPVKENLVIYELLVRDFIKEHTFKAVLDSLQYLKRLGINAIELMPVNEFEGNSSWGYNPSFYFAPDKYYGTKNDFKKFIDECHKNGIAVIIDMVLNHAYGQCPLVRLYPDQTGSPWFNKIAPHTDFSWGYDFNHESQATKDFIDRVTEYWIKEYKIDGFRFDFTRGFTNKSGGSGSYDESRISIIKRMCDKINSADTSTYVIIEHLVDSNDEMKKLADYGMLLWGNLNHNYNESTMGWNESGKSDFSNISYQKKGWTKPHLVAYMESHDEERLMYKNIQYGNSSAYYNVREQATALARIKLAGVFFFTIPGPKMIWQFGELGYDFSIDYGGRLSEKPIKWDYYQQSLRNEVYKVFSYLIKLKKEYKVFSSPDYSLNLYGSVKSIRLKDTEMNAVIIGNFDVTEKSINPQFYQTGKWYDYFLGDSILVNNTEALISLTPGEFHIYTTKRLPKPEPGILTEIEKNNTSPIDFVLNQNYPNPFNPSTTIEFYIPESCPVTLKIYNMIGQEVKTLYENEILNGKQVIRWDGKNQTGVNVSSGAYFYVLEANNLRLSKKMILIR